MCVLVNTASWGPAYVFLTNRVRTFLESARIFLLKFRGNTQIEFMLRLELGLGFSLGKEWKNEWKPM